MPIFKSHIHPTVQNQLLYWCTTTMALCLGLIIQFEASHFSWIALIFWVIFLALIAYFCLGHRLVIIDNQLVFKPLLGRKKTIALSDIKSLAVSGHNIRISPKKPNYIHYKFRLSAKNKNELVAIFEKNRVTILTLT